MNLTIISPLLSYVDNFFVLVQIPFDIEMGSVKEKWVLFLIEKYNNEYIETPPPNF